MLPYSQRLYDKVGYRISGEVFYTNSTSTFTITPSKYLSQLPLVNVPRGLLYSNCMSGSLLVQTIHIFSQFYKCNFSRFLVILFIIFIFLILYFKIFFLSPFLFYWTFAMMDNLILYSINISEIYKRLYVCCQTQASI